MIKDKEKKFRELVRLWIEKRCEALSDDLYEYSQNRLKGMEKNRIERHLYQCDNCRRVYEEFLEELSKESILGAAKGKITLMTKKLSLINIISSLKSSIAFPFEVIPLQSSRGMDKLAKKYKIGEPILLSLEAPREGHVVVFLYDNKGSLRLVFPRKKSDNTIIRPGVKKRITIKVSKPAGKKTFKALFVGKEKMKRNIFIKEAAETETIERILTRISNLSDKEWMEAEFNFDVA